MDSNIHPDDFDRPGTPRVAVPLRGAPDTSLAPNAARTHQSRSRSTTANRKQSTMAPAVNHARRLQLAAAVLVIVALVWLAGYLTGYRKHAASVESPSVMKLTPLPSAPGAAQSTSGAAISSPSPLLPQPLPTTPAVPQSSVTEYRNHRFGFALLYPSTLRAEGESANGDGEQFSAPDGSLRLSVWGSDNTQAQSLADMLQYTLSMQTLTVTYKHFGKDFYAVSGFLHADKILYERVTLRRDVFWGFRLVYDASRRQEYDHFPGLLTRGFRIP